MLLIDSDRCLDHVTQAGHPERPDRLRAIIDHLAESGLLHDLDRRDATPATREQLLQVHTDDHVTALERLSPAAGLVAVDPDTSLCPDSLTAATYAAGAAIDGVNAVLAGDATRVFCAVRPPGHHAEAAAAMGFCLFNNIALAAHTALASDHVQRVAILDFDVHHGNGTVDIFKDRQQVLVCSSFQHPFYPHRYADIDRENIVNTPLPAGTGSVKFRSAVERDWCAALERHRPEIIFISAGFDAHRDDPLAELMLTEEDFRWITELIVDGADRYAGGRIVAVLEGGYELTALARSVHAHLEVLNRAG